MATPSRWQALTRGLVGSLAFAAASWCGLSTARAGSMDPTPERLVQQPPGLPDGETCQSVAADPNILVNQGLNPRNFACAPNHAAFANMVSELGFAIAPNAFYPARTTGIGGFQLSVETNFTGINKNGVVTASTGQRTAYWQLGTRGGKDANVNGTPDSMLQIYALKMRKGLPFGFELAGSFGTIANTSLWVFGGDVRWSLLEGFRSGVLGALPDISVGAGVRTLTGTSRFYLTTVGLDVKLSKPFTLADSSQIIPVLGYQRLFVFGDSNVVDSTPNVDALDQCGFDGPDPQTGGPRCRNRLANGDPNSSDFSNSFSFNRVRTYRNRAIVGLNYRYEIMWLGGQIAFDLTNPKDENPELVGGRQWTLSFEAGVHF